MRYFVYKDSRVLGPFEPEELRQAADVRADSLICEESASGRVETDWRAASDVPELAQLRLPDSSFFLDEPVPGAGTGVLERIELEALGLPAAQDEADGWVASLFEDPEFRERWGRLLPSGVDKHEREIKEANRRMGELSGELEVLRLRLEEAERRAIDADAARRSAESAAERRALESAADRRAAERRAVEADEARKAAEASAQRQIAEADEARRAAEASAQRQVSQADQARRAAQESAQSQVSQAEEARRAAEASAQRQVNQADQARRAAEAAAGLKMAAAEEALRAAQAEVARLAAQSAAAASVESLAARVAEVSAMRQVAEADELRRAAETAAGRKVAEAEAALRVAQAEVARLATQGRAAERRVAEADEARKAAEASAQRQIAEADQARQAAEAAAGRKMAAAEEALRAAQAEVARLAAQSAAAASAESLAARVVEASAQRQIAQADELRRAAEAVAGRKVAEAEAALRAAQTEVARLAAQGPVAAPSSGLPAIPARPLGAPSSPLEAPARLVLHPFAVEPATEPPEAPPIPVLEPAPVPPFPPTIDVGLPPAPPSPPPVPPAPPFSASAPPASPIGRPRLNITGSRPLRPALTVKPLLKAEPEGLQAAAPQREPQREAPPAPAFEWTEPVAQLGGLPQAGQAMPLEAALAPTAPQTQSPGQPVELKPPSGLISPLEQAFPGAGEAPIDAEAAVAAPTLAPPARANEPADAGSQAAPAAEPLGSAAQPLAAPGAPASAGEVGLQPAPMPGFETGQTPIPLTGLFESPPAMTPPGVSPSQPAAATPLFGGTATAIPLSPEPQPEPVAVDPELMARLGRPEPELTTAARPPRRTSRLGLIVMTVVALVVGAVLYVFLRNPRDLRTLINMGADQKPLGAELPEEPPKTSPFAQPPALASATTTQAPAAAAPSAALSASSTAPTGTAEPAAQGLDASDAAIALTKDFPLDGGRGTVGQWLQYSFAANPSDGSREDWSAGAVDATTYLVQYRILGGQSAGRSISYLFEADVRRRTVRGGNPAARELLAGSSAPIRVRRSKLIKAPRARKVAGARTVRRRPRLKTTRAVPLLPLPPDSELLPPPDDDDATFRNDTVKPGL